LVVTTPPAQSRRLHKEVPAMNSGFLQHACDDNHYVPLQRLRPSPRTVSAATGVAHTERVRMFLYFAAQLLRSTLRASTPRSHVRKSRIGDRRSD
jgi:hypothetical protein